MQNEAAKIYRYEHEILPAMSIEDLMNTLVHAEIANQNIDGHQYLKMYLQTKLIRAEIVRRTK